MGSHMITKSPAVRVPPTSTTPNETLPLSSIDRGIVAKMTINTVAVFTHGVKAATRLRDAFAKALVHYYPVAGKITEINPGEPEVDCTGEGIWFVEAKANCSLEEVNYLERPLKIPREQLLPQPPSEAKPHEEIILLVQITEFTCGGFTLGVRFRHLVFDGLGFVQFLKAVGEMACGLPEPSVKPIWSREHIPAPPKVLHAGPSQSIPVYNLTTSVVDISQDSINRIKDLYMTETGKRSSTFDVVTAMIFKCRALAIDLAPEANVQLQVAAGTRHLLHGVLPSVEGYYGNCVHLISITQSREEINKASLVTVMSLIKGAKNVLSTKFQDWMYGSNELYHDQQLQGYGKIIVSDWSRIGLDELNFGWGQPRSVIPLNDDRGIVATAIYVKPPLPKTGIRLILRCVKEEHSTVFVEELSKMA